MMKLIGQKKHVQKINDWQSLPNFIMIEGPKGGGRKTLARYMAKQFDAHLVPVGSKIDDIRSVIAESANSIKECLYLVNVDGMSIQAKNSLLKVTEEPPKNCHIAMIVTSAEQTLPTLVSRAQLLSIEPYTYEDKIEYLDAQKFDSGGKELGEYTHFFNVLGEVKPLLDYGIGYVAEKCEYLWDNIWLVSPGNALNIVNWFKLKAKDEEDENKMDAEMFLKAFMNYISFKIRTTAISKLTWDEAYNICRLSLATSKCIRELGLKSRSKEITLNKWIEEVKTVE